MTMQPSFNLGLQWSNLGQTISQMADKIAFLEANVTSLQRRVRLQQQQLHQLEQPASAGLRDLELQQRQKQHQVKRTGSTTTIAAAPSLQTSSTPSSPPQKTTVIARAARFDSAQCRNAIQRTNAQAWYSMCSKRFKHKECFGDRQQYIVGAVRWPPHATFVDPYNATRVAYVRNQKAASIMLMEGFSRLFWARTLPTINAYANRVTYPFNKSTRVFTFVRDPFSMALSAYLELRFRATPSYPEAMLESGLWKKAESVGNGTRGWSLIDAHMEHRASMARLFPDGAGTDACKDAGDATHQFAVFLAAIRRTLEQQNWRVSIDIFHVFPQVLKLDHVQLRPSVPGLGGNITDKTSQRRYDAIGRVEDFASDLQQMRLILGNQAWAPDQVVRSNRTLRQFKKRTSHTHSQGVDTCAAVDRHDPRVRSQFCKLYAADYACFVGYESSLCDGYL